jgi:hypothetical protein
VSAMKVVSPRFISEAGIPRYKEVKRER